MYKSSANLAWSILNTHSNPRVGLTVRIQPQNRPHVPRVLRVPRAWYRLNFGALKCWLVLPRCHSSFNLTATPRLEEAIDHTLLPY